MTELGRLRAALDNVLAADDFTATSARVVWDAEELWSKYNRSSLGEMREVIEDRLYLARCRRVRAGF